MELSKRKLTLIILLVAAISCILMASLMYALRSHYFTFNGTANLNFNVGSVHATITFYKDGVKVFEQYHAGSFTKLGLNLTLAKLTGNFTTYYNQTHYNLNATYISIGDQGTLDTDSTELPGEWNRTSALLHDMTYNSFNLTAVFHPDTGPYTVDCVGVNFEDGIGNGALLCYDTFSESSGIDDTYTITIEFKISAA